MLSSTDKEIFYFNNVTFWEYQMFFAVQKSSRNSEALGNQIDAKNISP